MGLRKKRFQELMFHYIGLRFCTCVAGEQSRIVMKWAPAWGRRVWRHHHHNHHHHHHHHHRVCLLNITRTQLLPRQPHNVAQLE